MPSTPGLEDEPQANPDFPPSPSTRYLYSAKAPPRRHCEAHSQTRRTFHLRLTNDLHNVRYDFLSLLPAIYTAGTGEVRFRHLKYRALP